ncbi:MAG: CBS domain-containing protein, partial [Halobacteriota archaeon]
THTNLTFSKEPFVSSKDVVMVRKAEHSGVQKNRYVRKVLQVAEDIMSEPLITIGSDSRAVAAARLMVAKRVDTIPVVREESVVGVISKTDIVKRMVESGGCLFGLINDGSS